LALAAAVIALAVPSHAIAGESDVLLAALVLFTALGISANELLALRGHALTIVGLSVVPLLFFGAVGWGLGRPFGPDTQHGLLGVGLSGAEVAGVGLVGLAGADVTIAVGVVAGSLVASAILGPIVIGLLSPEAHVDGTGLLGRFAVVVIVPLIVGVAIRSTRMAQAWLGDHDNALDGLASLTVVALVYAALSGTHGAHGLGTAAAASALFLLVSGILATLWHRRAGVNAAAVPGAFTIAMRDFAVAATLATQAFGTAAGTVPGTYGVLMLIGGSIAATLVRSRPGKLDPSSPRSPERHDQPESRST
jgi:predicted Na+-dependent transporter